MGKISEINTKIKNIGLLYAGIDVGSTTTKTVVMEPESSDLVFTSYKRHHADQIKSVADVLDEIGEKFPNSSLRLSLTGSGAKIIADAMGLLYIQEVVANSVALRNIYDKVSTAIELGGQDAKVIFFREDEHTGRNEVYDMRMNGSCAGGTGAFLDEIASVLSIPVEELDAAASRGSCVYDVSGRCGVYAKTDIQPLLNQGVSKDDIALSAFHAIAKQTIGGLAQGLDIKGPVVFEGGPLTFNKTLIKVFAERLGLSDKDILVPEHPELMMAYGAALSMYTEGGGAKRTAPDALAKSLRSLKTERKDSDRGLCFFESDEEKEAFLREPALPEEKPYIPSKGETVKAYLGIDSGSTTTKFVLMNEDEEILYSFYASNEGDPLKVAKNGILAAEKRYEELGAGLEITGVGTTGYGEQLFCDAFSADCHVVETVAHARAAAKYVPGASFILDIGGQDMKAIWLENGIITNIVVNEACSSGCGSFLENFASSLNIPVGRIAESAFSSKNPAVLGSRCTVFMNSSIVTEQRNGKLPEDIMAGLCRSIIENVFTKVIRLSNVESLGSKIVVQGGTFRNDAVLRAMEQYIKKPVIRSPYPGLMGAVGAALITKERMSGTEKRTSFIGLEALKDFSYTQRSDMPCPFCTNHCKRTLVEFSNGKTCITNNRCEKGEITGDIKDENVIKKLKELEKKKERTPDLYLLRERLLFEDYPVKEPREKRDITIGIPRVLEFWDNMPFWNTFFRALGFKVKLSHKSTRKIYENGLSAVTSDTVCFPAKLVHGHIRDLAAQGVDRIFMPSFNKMPPETGEKTSESMCAVLKGYPIIIRNSDNTEDRWGIKLDAPMFFWFSEREKRAQIKKFMRETFGISEEETEEAIAQADAAQTSFRKRLIKVGEEILESVGKNGGYAVVLAGRPYQNDPLINHDLPSMLTALGIPVLTADSLPFNDCPELHKSRLDIVNNYHARMLSSAVTAAKDERLEYIQIVSFGCGHDAYLSDEITRLMKEISGKTPLILKLDESDVQGPLKIRLRSFTETVSMRRALSEKHDIKEPEDPYPVKFKKSDRKEKVVLVPNTSHAFSRVMAAAMEKQGLRAIPLEYGRETAIRLGKQYVHNDICFPAQMVIGETIAALKSGKYDPDNTAVGMGKYIGDCRLTHYSALLRKALDDAGFPQVPILTNDDKDDKNIHPGFRMNLLTAVRIAFAMPMIDVFEELLRKMRPYELKAGSADKAFDEAMDCLINGLKAHGIRGMKKGFKKGIEIMKAVDYDRSKERPKVLIVGEYLLNFHPGANHDIELYLEKNGFEIIEARMTDVIRKIYFNNASIIKAYHVRKPLSESGFNFVADSIFEAAHDLTDSIAKEHPLYEKATRLPELARESEPIIPRTFDAGEGILIPGEILHHAKNGCRAFIILQPFGCLPNHVVGRGIVKKLKELYPDAQMLSLDYDPDVSFANLENRLQMLVMNVREKEREKAEVEKAYSEGTKASKGPGKYRRLNTKRSESA